MSVLAATAIGAGISALTNMAVNAWNTYQTKKTNEKNESLMRESWQREDEAVQRRVADLKAAGMSPLLAAGSAASTSGPVSMNAPKSDFNIDATQALVLASSLKHQEAETKHLDAETKFLQKQYDNYGKPDWYVALKEIFGAEKFDKMLSTFGDAAYDWIMNFLGPSTSVSSPVAEVVNSGPFEEVIPGAVNVPGMVTPWYESEGTPSPLNNDWAEHLMEEAGVQTEVSGTDIAQANPSSYGIYDRGLVKEGEHYIEQLRKDKLLSEENVKRVANYLASIYNSRKGDIFLWLMDLAGLEH